MEKPMKVKCFACGAEEPGRVYLMCVHEGEEKFVCVRCLPMLIHGAH